MLVTVNGKRWNLVFGNPGSDCDGKCDPPDAKNKRIVIRPVKSREKLLELVIHESLHAADWSKDETWVEQVAEDVARILEKLIREGRINLQEA